MKEIDPQLLNVQKAALFLGVSRATIRQWAQTGKLRGVKVGTRGDWRFTKDELSKMIQINEEKFAKIKEFLITHASEIQAIADEKHRKHLGNDKLRSSFIAKQKKSHIAIVRELAEHIENTKEGEILFRQRGSLLAKEAVNEGLTLEEAVDGTIFLKQAFWEKLKEEGLLYELTAQDLYSFSHIISTYIDILAAKIAFAYHDYYRREEQQLADQKERFEEQVAESEGRYKNFIRLSSEGIWRFELEKPIPVTLPVKKQIQQMYRYAYLAECNDATAKMYGFSKASDIVGARLGDMLIESDEQNILYLTSFIKEKYALNDTESHEKDKKGNSRYFLNSLIGVVENGLLKRAWGTQRDITERKKAEEALQESEIRFKTLTSFAPVGIFQTDLDGNCLYVNKRWSDFSGLSLEQAKGQGWVKALHPEDKERVFHEWYQAAKQKKEFVSEYRFKSPKGKITWLRGNSVSVKDSDGNLTGYLGTISDISERKQTEDTLTFQASILNNITDSVITTDLQGKITYWNKGAEAIFGYSASEMLGKTPASLYPDLDTQQYSLDLKNILKGKNHEGEWKGKKKNGSSVWVNIKTTLLRDSGNTPIGFIGVASDITARKAFEDALKESEERLRLALNAGNVGVWDWDIINNRITWSDKIFEIHGISKKDFRGTVDEFIQTIYPDDKELVMSRLDQALQDKKPYQLEFRAYGPEKKVIWIVTSAQVMYEQKKPVRMLGATIDITERKHLEKQKDEFIGLASHELKTPVTSVKAFAQVLQRSFAKKGDERAALLLKKMDVQIDKLTVLIGDLLDVTRIQEGKLAFRKEYFDINELVKEVTEEVQRTTEKHTIITELQTTKSVRGDRDRYGQVITNFLTNAIKYSPANTKIIVKTGFTKSDVWLSVTDFGVGIPEDKQPRLFERFFRVSSERDTYPGLGLGLYICKEIITRQGGTISVKSNVGEGSTFSFTIPLIKQKG